MKRIQEIVMIFTVAFLFFSCEDKKNSENINENENSEASVIIDSVQQKYAPDKRVAYFNVNAQKIGNKYVLTGESDNPQAITELKERLDRRNLKYEDSIQMLPQEKFKETSRAVVKISVANIRSNPGHSQELATQALLGTPLKVLKEEDTWYLVQTPDGYLAWVDQGGLQLMNAEKFDSWLSQPKLIYTKIFGASYEKADENSQMISDLVAGDVLINSGKKGSFYQVIYPSGDTAFVKTTEAEIYDEWMKKTNPTVDNLVETSKSLMGLPYLWGGTSPKGVDCSGFTKTIYFLNGMVLPRDASQQVQTGVLVDSTRNWNNLQKGDLLFFGRKATDSTSEKAVHVGMWIGDNKFIHSLGNVHISTVDTTSSDFDEYNYNRYLRTKRLLNEPDEKIIKLSENNFYTATKASIK